MYGVMSRGYICPIVPAVLIDVRPTITGTQVLQPTIVDASLGPQPVPGGSVVAPIIISGDED